MTPSLTSLKEQARATMWYIKDLIRGHKGDPFEKQFDFKLDTAIETAFAAGEISKRTLRRWYEI